MSEEELIETAVDDIPGILDRVRRGWRSHLLWTEKQKREHTLTQLKNFKRFMDHNKKAICDAIQYDLHKSEEESLIMEYNLVYHDLVIYIRDFDDFTKPRPAQKDLANILNTLYIKPEPHGVVLIVGAWNYPFQLAVLPMIGAIAAGNAVVLKPSELSVRSSNLLTRLLPEYLDQDYYGVIPGGVTVAQNVVKERYDYVFYTGSTVVGKLVMEAAAKHLTPVTLELGGKSPVVVTDDANIKIAAKRVMWGKLANSGQTCIAPDYVLCSSRVRDKFVDACREATRKFYGQDPSKSKDYGRIVNGRHFNRLCKLMSSSKGQNVMSGDTNEDEKYIAPAIYVNIDIDDSLMQEELFGPILPVLTFNEVDEAIQFVNERERPLAFYVFTENSSTFEKIAGSTSSGCVAQNNTIMYAGVSSLPFGGVGHSGMGAYHGKFTFDTFSHMKPVHRSMTKLDSLNDIVYPPYTKNKLRQVNFMQIPSSRRWGILRPLLLISIIAAVAILLQIYGIPRWVYKY